MTAFTDLTQALAWVFDLQKFGIKFGLSSTLDLLARLDLPYQQGRYLHIAGTNGKGSVAAMLSAVLTRAGYPVGLFTSPHLVSLQERFRLRDQEISADALLHLINRVADRGERRRAPHLLRIRHRHGLALFSGGKGRPHHPGDRHGGASGRHQHRPAAGFGDHQYLPGP